MKKGIGGMLLKMLYHWTQHIILLVNYFL